MAFTFDFDLKDDLDESFDALSIAPGSKPGQPDTEAHAPNDFAQAFAEADLSDLLNSLSDAISYSFLQIPASETQAPVRLARRELFDARFQVAASDQSDGDATLNFLDTPSDILPWEYEGGLKTWECSIDLARHVDWVSEGNGEWVLGKRVLEVGCGTAVPSLLLFHRLLHHLATRPLGDAAVKETGFHLQDYNRSVLELVTLPNFLLAWYNSPLAETFKTSEDHPEEGEEDHDLYLSITPALVRAFRASLAQHRIELQFFSGSWDGFDMGDSGAYDVVLTSETIYRSESTPSLLRLLRDACLAPRTPTPTPTQHAHVEAQADDDTPVRTAYTCLVAAKVLYFGVGGGIADFVRAVEDQDRGRADVVWEQTTGVARRILSITWNA